MTQPPRSSKRPARLALVHLLPNLVTIGAICAGLTSIRMALQGRFELAAALILLAAILDGLDGPLARMLKSESKIGAELDSLADFLNFGVATGLFLYIWTVGEGRNLLWVAVMVYTVCTVLRLARFNVSSREETNRPPTALGEARPVRNKGFTGVPSPAGALLALLPFALHQVFGWLAFQPELIACWLMLVGLAMISRLPTPSLKSMRIPRENVRFLLVGLVAFVAVAFTWPWIVLLVTQIGYAALIAGTAWRGRKKVNTDGS